jgi:ABC-type transport system substrate-binding protein/methyl-accepting chemotaxis protein
MVQANKNVSEGKPAKEAKGPSTNGNRTKKSKAQANGSTGAIERVASALAHGDLRIEVLSNLDTRSDKHEGRTLTELSSLARSMRRTVGHLRNAANSIEEIAEGVLKGATVLSSSISEEAASVDATVSSIEEISASTRSVAEAVSALSNLAQTTSTSSLEMAASIDMVSANVDALTAFVEDTASAIEQMAASVRNVASSTESLAAATDETETSMRAIDESTQRVGLAVSETAVLAEEVQSSAEQGSSIVVETAESMRATRRGIEEAAETIAALGERSERIGAITRVIEEIADRTNLLALNARILAAQAGQQGRGFAVVAEEIKELSERTARSTQEIDELIKSVRESVTAAISQSSNNRQLADEGVRLAESAANSLNEISQKTASATAAIRQIAEAAATQSLESHQVTELTAHVRHRAQEIERATSEQARTSQQIGERAVRMAELTEHVRRAMQEQATASKHIAQAMEKLTDVVDQISNAIREQYGGAEDVLRAMSVIRDAVTKSQSSIIQINHTVGLLDHEVISLRESVKYFQLSEPLRGGTLHLGFPVAPGSESYDSHFLGDITSIVLEGLVTAGEVGDVKPALAESWEISADGRTYTFALRNNALFHNGRTMKGEDVIYSIKRSLRTPPDAWVFKSLRGADGYISGESEDLPGARIRDDYTVELELAEPLAFFLQMLCVRAASIVPREEIEVDGGVRFAEFPIGTGPFQIEEVNKNTGRIELNRFPEYWNQERPYIDKLIYEFNPDSSNLYERLKAGQLSLVCESTEQNINKLASDSQWHSCIVAAPQLHTHFLAFDCDQPPFNDPRIRRAVGHVLDKNVLVRDYYGESAGVASGPIPPGLIGFDSNFKGLEYDPENALRLMSEAGYARGFRLKLWRSTEEQNISPGAGEYICEQLAKIGIKCDITVADQTEVLSAARDGRAQLSEQSWYGEYADPDFFTYTLFHSSNARSKVGRIPAVEEIDWLSLRARTLFNRVERSWIYRKLQQKIAEEVLCVFLTHRRAAIIHGTDVEGLQVHMNNPIIRPQEIWLARS